MYAAAFIGDKIIDLAGWDQGPGAETSNLRISYDNQFQPVSYVGGTWGRQFWRPGTMANISFDSRLNIGLGNYIEVNAGRYDYDYQKNVTTFITKIPTYFSNQSGALFKMAQPNPLNMGVRQRERTQAVGTVTTAGTANIVVTYPGLDGSPLTIPFDVEVGDTNGQWVEKARIALSESYEISMYFDVQVESGTNISLVRRSPWSVQVGGSAFNIAIDKGTSNGIVDDPTSVNNRSAVDWDLLSSVVVYDANISVAASQVGTSVLLNTSVTGRLAAP